MKQTWLIRLLNGLGFALVALFLLDWCVLMFSPPWITLPDTLIVHLALITSVYSLLLRKFVPEEMRPKPHPLVKAIVIILIALVLLSGLYQLWQLG